LDLLGQRGRLRGLLERVQERLHAGDARELGVGYQLAGQLEDALCYLCVCFSLVRSLGKV
jgi:hypothetical protein